MGRRMGRTMGIAAALLLALAGNFVWLSEKRHAVFREASWRALDSLAYQATELKTYQTQSMQMLFHVDGQSIDTFTLADTQGNRYTLAEWIQRFCPELASEDMSPVVPPAGKNRREPSVLVFRYTELDCMTCTERQIALMQQACRQYPGFKCVIFTTYAHEALLWQFVRMNQLDIPIFQVPADAVFGGVGVPFYFVMDASLRYRHVFVPNKSFEELAVDYLTALAKPD
ncbi:MAG: hypothetical protein IKI72_01955 [Bacteroidales bacterium]|nr:hypothetical protein [Bacteroidales bacterium]